ncbi:MAG TPA: hypothetical protein VEX15_24075 [Nocardioidaceae bacterium]|nr:hypothetical protein [Nocardioidaceae bacterium]
MAMFNPPAPQVLVTSSVQSDGAAADQVANAPKKGVAESRPAQVRYLLGAYVLIVAGISIGWIIYVVRDPAAPVAVAGVGVFAGFYVVAQGLERLLDPFQNWTGAVFKGVDAPKEDVCTGQTPITGGALEGEHLERVRRKSVLKTRRAQAIKTAIGGSDEAAGAALVAAEMQASVQQYRRNSAVLMWGLSSSLAIIISASVGLALLHSVGVQDAPMMLDIVVTGITIGSGTKPLHDLISSLQVAKDSKKDPDEVSSS